MLDREHSTIFQLAARDLHWRQVEDSVLALDVSSSEYFEVNASGAILWNVLVEGATEQELVEALTGAEEVDRERAAGDVKQFLADLRERGLLIERVPDGSDV